MSYTISLFGEIKREMKRRIPELYSISTTQAASHHHFGMTGSKYFSVQSLAYATAAKSLGYNSKNADYSAQRSVNGIEMKGKYVSKRERLD